MLGTKNKKKWRLGELPLVFSLIFSGLFLSACSHENNGGKTTSMIQKQERKTERDIIKAGSTAQYMGKPGQLLIVANNTEYIEEITMLFDSVFADPIRPYYPPTPHFECYQKTPEEFKKRFTKVRNVIELVIDEKIEKGNPKMWVYDGYYAKTQIYTLIKANNINDLHQKISQELNYLLKVYDTQEWKREYYRHRAYKNEKTRSSLQKKFGIDLELPGNYKYESIDNQYAIIIFPERSRQMDLKMGSGTVSKANFIQSGVMIWQYPYIDSSQLQPEKLIQMRDTILKKYAKHEMPGVYMGTQYHPAVIPISEKISIGDVQGFQFRGLYKFTGAAEPSGGRFWSFHFKHPYRNTIVAISGYFDVPPTATPYFEINQIRAIIYSLKVIQ